jgi:hypothetical protein
MAELWNENLERLLDLAPDGADSDELSSALKSFLQAWNDGAPDATLDAAVTDIAAAVNMDPGDARQAFDRFRQAAGDESHNDAKDGFVGSKQQLLFGHVVGGVLDIEPVFAALLSPTGGMVGPGGLAFHVKGGVLGFHGVSHDAGGYLCRKHGIDPGYEYVIDKIGLPCEDSPLEGQVSGIAFWFKLLRLGWLNFLADSVSLSASLASDQDIDSFLERGPVSISEITPSDLDEGDGVILNPAEVRLLQVLITRESDPPDADMVAQGLESLQQRELVTGNEQDGFDVMDELILAMAVALEPELILKASSAEVTEAAGAGGQALRLYKWGDYIVEKTSPSQDHLRLAGLRDASEAQERLLQVMPLSESDLEAISLSLADTISATTAGDIEPGPELETALARSRSAALEAVSDLTAALELGQVVRSIRIEQFAGRTLAKTRDLEFIQGAQATWLVSRDSQQADQVEISLTTPATIGQELGLSPSTGS